MTTSNWSLKGDYFENCNRVGLCPCPFGGDHAEGHCDVGFAFHVDEGAFDGVALDGLNLAAGFYTPGSMPDGNWIGAAYVDERASPQQREALGEIMSGKFGGPFERFMRLTAGPRGSSTSLSNTRPKDALAVYPYLRLWTSTSRASSSPVRRNRSTWRTWALGESGR